VPSPRSPIDRRAGPLVFAHRGGRTLGPENTLVAFEIGVESGADGLELDVHVSRDGVPVVHHDADLDRCTDGSGPIAACTADELARLDAAWRFGEESGFPWRGRGVSVPTLAAVLARFDVPTIVEIKAGTEAAARAVVDVVRAAGAIERVCVGSFSHVALRAVRAIEPALATGAGRTETQRALYRTWVRVGLGRVPYRAFQVPELAGRLRVVSPAFIAAAHRAGLALHVWTVNERHDMWRMLDWGIDGLISDRPDLAVEVRNEWRRRRQHEDTKKPPGNTKGIHGV